MGGTELPIVTRLREQVQDLKRELSHEIPKALEEARAHGDLSENAEYEAAKERQSYLRARISQLEGRIRELSLYTISSLPQGVAGYGSTVEVEDLNSGEKRTFKLVFPEEADAGAGSISITSPLGRALLNRAPGDEVVAQTPGGKRQLRILSLVTFAEAEEGEGGGDGGPTRR